MRLILKLVGLALLVCVLYTAYLAFEVWRQSRIDETHAADAIVVLGAAQYDGKPSPVLKARLDQAAYLYGEGIAPLIVATGGKQEGDRFTEAEASHRYLEEQGIPAGSILEETDGRTTWESLQAVDDIADSNGIESAVFVSDPLHSERIERMATDLGFDPVYTSWASYERLDRSRESKLQQLAREVASLLVYEFLDR